MNLPDKKIFPTLTEQEQTEWINQDNQKDYQFNIVMQCIAKGEELYVKEWVEYHLNIGIEHVYIYDNNDDTTLLPDYLQNVLSQSSLSKVTVIPFNKPFIFPQNAAMQHFLKTYGNLTRWVLSIDLDEFFFLEKPMQEFLEEFSYASQVYFSWENFGANGQLYHFSEPVMERFTQTVEMSDLMQGKTMVRPRLVTHYHIHSFNIAKGAKTVNTKHESIEEVPISSTPETVYETAWIKHYFTKSLEEWEAKIKRGCVDDVYGRKYDLFFELNPDLLEFKKPDFQTVQAHTNMPVNRYEQYLFTEMTEEQKAGYIKEKLRQRRVIECFAVVDRAVWYDNLTSEQKADVNAWRNQWLDVTETMVIPEKPEWLLGNKNKEGGE